MKAVTYHAFGPAAEVLHLADLPPALPGAGEVVVDLAYSGVNPSDVKARAGVRPGVTELPYPFITPHSDGSGIISQVGDGVPQSRIGQRVWIWNGQWDRARGTAAEEITLPSEQAVELPDKASLETGAVLGIPGLTACHTVFSGGEIDGQTVLIHGGAGTVGYLAVQLARAAGAKVIATASTGAHDRVLDAGADTVIDYSDPDIARLILAANGGAPITRIVDVEFGANIETNAQVIAPNGRINAYGSAKNMTPSMHFGPLLFKAVTVEITLIYILPPLQRQRAIERLSAALSDNALTCPIQKVFALHDCDLAHQAVEAGHRSGAVLVDTANST